MQEWESAADSANRERVDYYAPGTERLLADLMAQVGQLTQSLNQLAAQNREISAENKAIRADNARIRAEIAKPAAPTPPAQIHISERLAKEFNRLRALSEEAHAQSDKAMARADYAAAQADFLTDEYEREQMLRGAFGARPMVEEVVDVRGAPVPGVAERVRRTKRWEAYLAYTPEHLRSGPQALPPGS